MTEGVRGGNMLIRRIIRTRNYAPITLKFSLPARGDGGGFPRIKKLSSPLQLRRRGADRHSKFQWKLEKTPFERRGIDSAEYE